MSSSKDKKSLRKKIVFRWTKIAVIVYSLTGIAIYYLQDRLILQPLKVDRKNDYGFSFPHEEVNVPYDKNTNINIIKFTVPDTVVKGVVLYFHGNKNNIYRYRNFAPNFTKHGYEVWMIDYPGFGKSTGIFTEDVVYEWSLILYKMARSRFTPDEIILYGKSLGSGIAAQLASVRDCKQLILETPYSSMIGLAEHYIWMYPVKQMLKFKLPTKEFLTKVTAPITIFHGTADPLIPYSNASELKEVLKKNDEFITIEGGNHRNLNTYSLMQQKLDSLLSVQ